MTTSHKTDEFGTDYVPTIGMKINKDFGSKGFFEGKVTSGPHSRTVNGDNIVLRKVRYEDGDHEEMTVSEIAASRGGTSFKVKVEAYKAEEDSCYQAIWGSVGSIRRCSSKTGKGR